MQQLDPFKDSVAEALEHLAGISFHRIFYGWALYSGDHFIGIIKYNKLYLRTNHLTRLGYLRIGMRPLDPKDHAQRSFYQVPSSVIHSPHELERWTLEAAAIPYTVPKSEGEYRGG